MLLLSLFIACLPEQSPAPSVVLITWDTVRQDRLQAGVAPRAAALARSGVLFTQARATYPMTLPSHASLLSGAYPATHKARQNGSLALRADIPLLQEGLQAAGWSTGGFVSASVLRGMYGLSRGFDVYDDTMTLGAEQAGKNYHRSGPETLASALAWTEGLSARSPMFLWVHLFEPHQPWEAPSAFSEKHADPYDAEIAYTDQLTGELLDALEEMGRLDRSIVVLTSDHGEGLGEHGEDTHGTLIYDSTMHVPLVIWAGADSKAEWPVGRTIDDVVSLVDVAPTLAALAEVPLESDGLSLVPALQGSPSAESRAVAMESLLASRTFDVSPLLAVVTSDQTAWIDSSQRERYDLVADPGQLQNLYQELDAQLFDEALGGFDWGDTEVQSVSKDQETLEQMAALGYVVLANDPDEERQHQEDVADVVELIEELQHFREAIENVPTAVRSSLLRLLIHGSIPPWDRLREVDAWRASHELSSPALERQRVHLLDDLGRYQESMDTLAALVQGGKGSTEDTEELERRRSKFVQDQRLAENILGHLGTSPSDWDAHYDLGLTLYRLEQHTASEEHLETALAGRPEDLAARRLLITLLLNLDRSEEVGPLLATAAGETPWAPCLREWLPKRPRAMPMDCDLEPEAPSGGVSQGG